MDFEVIKYLITGKTPLKIKEVRQIESFASCQHLLGKRDKSEEPRS